MKESEILGIDIGATGIKGAPVDITKGELTADRYKLDTPSSGKPKDVVKVVAELVDKFGWHGPIGFGFPGVIQHGVARTSANLDNDFIGVNLRDLFHETLGLPTFVANDADVAGMAEMAHGKGRGVMGTVVMITIGTGLGSALFRDGVLIPNTEFGHLFYKKSVFEHYASNRARKEKKMSWSEWGRQFSVYLNHLNLLLCPDLFILGGGISKKFEQWKSYIKVPVDITDAELRNDAGIIGAAMYAASKIPTSL